MTMPKIDPRDRTDEELDALRAQFDRDLGELAMREIEVVGVSAIDVAHSLLECGLGLLEVVACPCCLEQELKDFQDVLAVMIKKAERKESEISLH
jgi:hypothetical protein